MRPLFAAILILAIGDLSVQAAIYSYIQQKPPFGNPAFPWIEHRTLPRLGSTFDIQVMATWASTHSPAREDHFLMFGVSNPHQMLPGLGGWLFSSAEIVMRTPSANGAPPHHVTMSFAIPTSPQWLGVRFYNQVLVHAYGGPAGDFIGLSRGGVGVIGR